jgi:oxygen-dependent protoporphyrinogen oxidase
LALSDDELIDLAISETARVLGVVPQPSWTRVVRHVQGIPQYNVGHLDWVDRLESTLSGMPGLHLAGWGYHGVGVSSLAKYAAELGDALLA